MRASPLHILFVAPFGLRQKTTVWARILPLARQLVARGLQCTILVPPWDSPEDGGLVQNVDGVALVQVNVQGGLPAIVARLMQEIALRKPDIVHCVKPRAYAGIVHWLLWQQRRVGKPTPRIILDLDDWEQAWQPVNRYPPPVAKFLAWQEEWGIRHADGITVASRWLEMRAHEYAPATPILYLPNGVEIPQTAPFAHPATPAATAGGAPARRADSTPDDQLAEIGVAAANQGGSHPTSHASPLTPHVSVLWFTRFVEVEPTWFGAFANSLFEGSQDARLIIAGSPLHNGGDEPFRAAVPGEYTERVSWLGYAPSQALPSLYAASSVAIFPAERTVLQMAKCSVRLATTLLAGVPVVASSVGEQTNYGAGGSTLLVAGDATPQAFAAAVLRLLQDPARQTQIVDAARAHLAARYQWSTLVEDLVAFYGA